MYPVIVSFFTKDWVYPKHAERLKKECDALGLESVIRELPSRNGYIQNTCHKPFFIRKCLEELKRPVLWIDVDGSIYSKPDFFLDTDYDFQARKMNPKHRKRTWHVGTMWFNYTPAMLTFIEEWCRRTGDMTDESALDQTWKRKEWGLRTREVPAEYFHIIRREPPPPEIVIGHRLSKGASKRKQTPYFEAYERRNG